MITNSAVPNAWVELTSCYVCFDGCQVVVFDKDGRELSHCAMAAGYLLTPELMLVMR